MDQPHQIRRKPVPGSVAPPSPPPEYVASPTSLNAAPTEGSGYDVSLFDHYSTAPSPVRPQCLSVDDAGTSSPIRSLRSTQSSPNLRPLQSRTTETAQKAGKAVVGAFEEARHFAGGLVSHPFESTKHYSILRHSHGLVFYSGSYTNIAITVFSDRELPADRSFWLQRKGWSGKTGLRAGALLGTHSAWINVTPSVITTADQVKPADERAWQRDIAKFLRKAPSKLASHVTRETEVLRVPCSAEDGYLRIVMCSGEGGKKYLCPSPVFRLASASMESSSLRGASLKTLPIEAAVKVGTVVGTQVVRRFAGPYVETAKAFVGTQATSIYQPTAVQTAAVRQAYDSSGVSEQFEDMNGQYDARRQAEFTNEPNIQAEMIQPAIIGDADGPEPPFPVRYHGKVVPGKGESTEVMGYPTANLSGVNSDIRLKHGGVYFGYAAIGLNKKLLDELRLDEDWHQALIYIVPTPGSQANVVYKKSILVHILEDFEGTKFYNAKLSVMMMGILRPVLPLHLARLEPAESQREKFCQDVAVTRASLSRAAWAADMTLERVRTVSSGRSLTERYVDMRQGVQNSLDKVPTHRLGVRTEGAVMRDRYIGNGGLSIPR